MRQIINTRDGGYEVLQVQEAPDLEPGRNELLIQVKAAGLNFADIQARRGQYMDAPPKPCVMGYEVSGVVKAVGDDVEDSWLGKEVLAMTRFGGQAGQVVVNPLQVYEKPANLTFEQAAAVPVNYLTAYVLLVVMGALKAEESILIHNVGGGVGLAALDIARHIGATTYGTASGWKHDFLTDRGLDYPIDYRKKDWYREVMDLTDKKGVELIIDPLGGKEWKRSYRALRTTGRLGMFGVSSASRGRGGRLLGKWKLLKTVLQMPFFHPIPLLDRNRGVFGVNLGHMWDEKDKARKWIDKLLEGIREGWIHPHIDATFSFDEVTEAHRYLEERKNIGKVLLVP